MANMRIPYTKPWLDVPDQVAKLKARGLSIADEAAAARFIRYVNYYRFSGFCLRFQHWDATAGEKVFLPGVRCEDIVDLCDFDSALRDCLSDALEMVEISLRTSIAFHFGRAFGPFGHADAANFDKAFSPQAATNATQGKSSSTHGEWHKTLIDETRRSRELFVDHFRDTYSQYPDLPIWMVSEICSFGTLSRMYSNLRNREQGAVARDYSIQFVILKSWLHTFTFARNVCAHHARLWDRQLSISPKIPGGKRWGLVAKHSKTIYAVALMLNWMLANDSIPEGKHSEWKRRMETLMRGFAARFPQLLHHTGFPIDWTKDPLWWQV